MADNGNINSGNLNIGRTSMHSREYDEIKRLLEDLNQSNKSVNEQLLYRAEREYEEQNREISPINGLLNAFNMGMFDNRKELQAIIAELKSLNEQAKKLEKVNEEIKNFFSGQVTSGVVEDYNTEISDLDSFIEGFDEKFSDYLDADNDKVITLRDIVQYDRQTLHDLKSDFDFFKNMTAYGQPLEYNDIIDKLKSVDPRYNELLEKSRIKEAIDNNIDYADGLSEELDAIINVLSEFDAQASTITSGITNSMVEQFRNLNISDELKAKIGLDEATIRRGEFNGDLSEKLANRVEENTKQNEEDRKAIEENTKEIKDLKLHLTKLSNTIHPLDVASAQTRIDELIAENEDKEKAITEREEENKDISKIEGDVERLDKAAQNEAEIREKLIDALDESTYDSLDVEERLENAKAILNGEKEKLKTEKELLATQLELNEAQEGMVNRQKEINDYLKDTVAKRREEEALIRKGANRLATIKGIYHAIVGTLGKALGIWMEYEDTTFKIARGMGLNREQAQALTTANIKNVEKLAIAYGVSKDAIMKLQQGITDATQRNIILTREQTENLLALSKIADEATVSEAVESGAQLGISINDSMAKLALTQEKARALGLNAAKASQAFAKNMHLASTYSFRNGTNGLANMLLLSQKLRFNMESITSAADKFQDIEGSIETAAKIQMLGGSYARNFSNPMAIMYEATSDIESFTERIVRTVRDKGVFNRETGEVKVAPIDRAFIREFASAIGMSFDEVMKMVNSQVRNANIDNEISKSQNFSEIEKSFIETNAEWNSENRRFELAILDQNGKEVGTKAVSSITKEDIDKIQTNTLDEKNMFKDTRQIRNAVLQIAKNQGIQMTSLSERKEGFQNATGAAVADFTDSTGLGRGLSNLATKYAAPAGDFLLNMGSTVGGVILGGTLLGGLFKNTPFGRNVTRGFQKGVGSGFERGTSTSGVRGSTNSNGGSSGVAASPREKWSWRKKNAYKANKWMRGKGISAKGVRGISKVGKGLGWGMAADAVNWIGKGTGAWDEGSGADKVLSTVGDIGTGAMIGNLIVPGLGGIVGGALGGIYGVYKNFGDDIKGWFSGKDKKDEALAKKTEESGDAINTEFGSDSVYYAAATSILAMQDPLVRIASKNPTTVVRVTPQEQSVDNINSTTMEQLASVSESFDTIQENISNITSSVGNIEQTTLSSTELLKEVNTNNVNLASTQMESITRAFNDFISSDAYLASINTFVDNIAKNQQSTNLNTNNANLTTINTFADNIAKNQQSTNLNSNNANLTTINNGGDIDTKISEIGGDVISSKISELAIAYATKAIELVNGTSVNAIYNAAINKTISDIANNDAFFTNNGVTNDGSIRKAIIIDNNNIDYTESASNNLQNGVNASEIYSSAISKTVNDIAHKENVLHNAILKGQYNSIFNIWKDTPNAYYTFPYNTNDPLTSEYLYDNNGNIYNRFSNNPINDIITNNSLFTKNGSTKQGDYRKSILIDNDDIEYNENNVNGWVKNGVSYKDIAKTQYNNIFGIHDDIGGTYYTIPYNTNDTSIISYLYGDDGSIYNTSNGIRNKVNNNASGIYNFGGNNFSSTKNGFGGYSVNGSNVSMNNNGDNANNLFSIVSNNGDRLSNMVYGRGDDITNNIETNKDGFISTIHPIPNNGNTYNEYDTQNSSFVNGIEPQEPNIVPITNIGGETPIVPSNNTVNNYNNNPYSQQQWQYMQPNNASMDVNINGTIRLQGDSGIANMDIMDLIERNPTLRSRIVEMVVDGMYRKFGYGRNYMSYNSIKQGGTSAPFSNA